MNSNFRITIADPNANGSSNSNASGSVMAPDTGSFTNNMEGPVMTGIGATVIIISLILAISYIINRQKNHRSFLRDNGGMKLHSTKRFVISVLVVALSSIGIASGFTNSETIQSEQASATSTSDSLAIVTNDIDLSISMDGESAFGFVPNEVTVSSSTNYGYTLGVYASGANIVSETSENNAISGLSTTTNPTALNRNTWGISTELPSSEASEVWRAMPTSQSDMLTVKSTSTATQANDTTTVYYGAFITNELPYGTYNGPTINYVAVANPTPDDIIEANWTFYGEPSSTDYFVQLNRNTGDYSFEMVTSGCSIVPVEDCPAPREYSYTETVPPESLPQVLSLYEQLNFSASSQEDLAIMLWFGLFYFYADPTSDIAEEGYTVDEEYREAIDANGDGIITKQEFADYLAFVTIPNLLDSSHSSSQYSPLDPSLIK